MSLYKDASLVMIPSAYKDGKLYSIRPTDGDGDFTFSRGSNLAATRVDVNGLIEKGRENLVLHSNSFDNAYWNKSDSSIVTGQADPSGGTNAFKIVENTNTAYHRINGNYTMVSGNVYATSVTAKAAGRNYLTLSNNVSAGTTIFNLTDGSVELQESGVISASTTSLGGGWYRCEMVAVGDKSGTYNVFIGADDDGVIAPYTGNGTSGVLIYQSQLEAGLVATDYIETTSSTAQAGILEDMPRLDYSGGASCPALLLEPQRTNLVPYSEYFGTSDWVKLGVGTGSTPVITYNYAESPEGLNNATRIQLDLNGGTSSGDQSLIYDDLGAKTGDHTRSVYIKSLTTDTDLYFGGTLNDKKTITATTEWQRFDFTSDLSAQTLYVTIGLRGTTGSSDVADILVWGFQVEEGSYPTSYIPTYGASVTRSDDSCIATSVSDLIGQTQGTMFIDFVFNGNPTSVDYSFMILGAIGSNYITIGGYNTSLYARVFDSTSQGTINALQMVAGTRYKVAVGYAENDVVMYVNGVNEGSDTSVSIPAVSQIGFTRPSFVHSADVNQSVVFPTRLTNAELAALTTI